MKKSLLLLTFLAFVASSQAQNIPENVEALVTVDFGSLNKKLDTKFKLDLDVTYDVLTKPETVLLNAIKSPKAMGLDKSRRIIMYTNKSASHKPISDKVVILPIENLTLFEEVVVARLEAASKMTRSEREGQKYFNYAHTNVVYNNEYAAFQRTDNYSDVDSRLYNSQYFFEYNEVVKSINRERMGLKPGEVPGSGMNVEQQVETIHQSSKHLENEGTTIDVEEAVEVIEIEDAVPIEEAVEDAEEAVEAVEEIEEDYYSDYKLKQKAPGYDYDNHPLMVAFEKNWIERNKQKVINENLQFELANLKRNKENLEQGSSSSEDYKQALNSKHDMSIYYSALSANNMMTGMMGYSYKRLMRDKDKNELVELLEGNYTIGHLDFDGNAVQFNLINHLSEQFKNYNSLVDKPVNQKFQYYLPKGTPAYYSMYFSPEKLYNSYRDMMDYSLRDSRYNREGGLITLDLFDMFIDKEMLFETFRGDMLYAIPGVKTTVEERNGYKYNPDTYEREAYTYLDTIVAPEMVMLATVKSKSQMQELIDAFEKRGFLVKRADGIYQVVKRRRSEEVEMSDYYLAMKEDVFVVTNHNKLSEYLGSGLPSGLRMELDQMASLSRPGTHATLKSAFFDLPSNSRTAKKMYRQSPMRRLGVEMEDISEVFENVNLETTTNDNGELTTSVKIDLKEDVNVLQELLQSLKND